MGRHWVTGKWSFTPSVARRGEDLEGIVPVCKGGEEVAWVAQLLEAHRKGVT
jgi:hypothetical protein